MSTGDCGCWTGAWWGVVPPPRCAMHYWSGTTIGNPMTFTSTLGSLSDADVERIAQRVAKLLKESK